MDFGFELARRVCVASTCSTSVVPIPKANAPNAPWVEVWLSPQTIVIPGSVNLDQSPNTITFNVDPVNDPPEGTSKIIPINEDQTYTFSTAGNTDFGFTDPFDTPANGLARVRITTLPTNGTLSVIGKPALIAGDFVTNAAILAGNLQFKPAQDAFGNPNPYSTFTFRVRDSGDATIPGAVVTDPTARLFRQPGIGDWGSVIERVAAALADFRGSVAR